MAKRKPGMNVLGIVLLILLVMRFVSNLLGLLLGIDLLVLALVAAYGVALYGVLTKKMFGYLVAVGVSAVDVIFAVMLATGGALAAAVGSSVVDVLIIILAYLEYQKMKK